MRLDEIGVDIVLGVIGLDRHRRAEILVHEAGMRGGDLDPDDLSLEAVGIVEIDVIGHRLGADDRSRRVVVLIGEVDHLLALVGDQHRRPDDVELVRLKRRDDAVPGGLHDGAFGLHLGADGVHEIDLEADPFAGGILAGERRIRLRGDAEANDIFRAGGEAAQRQHRA